MQMQTAVYSRRLGFCEPKTETTSGRWGMTPDGQVRGWKRAYSSSSFIAEFRLGSATRSQFRPSCARFALLEAAILVFLSVSDILLAAIWLPSTPIRKFKRINRIESRLEDSVSWTSISGCDWSNSQTSDGLGTAQPCGM
jgi:hypothetical protein